MDLDVVFVGTAGSAPTARRGLPATMLRRGGDKLLFDCGEGTQRQLLRSIGLVDVHAVFVTHFHADHFLGLPGLLKTFSLRDRERPLSLYGPKGFERLWSGLAPLVGRTPYEVAVEDLEPNRPVRLDGYSVTAFEVDHHGPSFGYAVVEEDRPGRFDEDRALALGVAPGPDFGRLQHGEPVQGAGGRVAPDDVLGEARRGRRIVLAGDCSPSEMTRLAAREADLLVHEATFLHEEAERARETGHSTALEAAELARDAGVRMLALTHLSQRYGGAELRDEARTTFESTIVPRDFDRVEVPFPERGEPLHVRAEAADRPATVT